MAGPLIVEPVSKFAFWPIDLPLRSRSSRNVSVWPKSGFRGPRPHRPQELLGSLFPERTLWSGLIVLPAPSFDLGPCIVHRQKSVYTQALISKTFVERFDACAVSRSSRTRKIECDAGLVGPEVQCLRDELRPVVQIDSFWLPVRLDDFVQKLGHV